MHLVFQISELVRTICQHIQSKNDLLHLGCSTSLFLEPALDMIWWEQHGLRNFFECLPYTVWRDKTPYDEASMGCTLKQLVRAEEWERFNFYAKRVRNLFLETTSLADITIYHTIVTSVPIQPFYFPRLTSITLKTSAYALPMDCLKMLLAPSLTQLSILLDRRADQSLPLLSFLYQLHSRCPNISDISVFAPGFVDPDGLNDGLSSAIMKYTHLTKINLPDLSGNAIQHIAKLDSLTSLGMDSMSRVAPYPLKLDTNSFPALQVLDLHATTLQCSTILQSIASDRLHNIQLTITGPCSFPSWTKLINALAVPQSRHTSLYRLDINELSDERNAVSDLILALKDVRPLLCLQRLLDVTLNPGKRLDLINDDIEQLAKSWPELRCLTLGSRTDVKDAEPPCRVTIEALRHFVDHCPLLCYLSIDFTTVGSAFPTYPPGQGPSSEMLCHLDCSTALITADDVHVAVSHISGLFPSLNKLHCNEAHSEASKLWRHIEEMLPVMRNLPL